MELLPKVLADGPMPVTEVFKIMSDHGLSEKSVYSAGKAIGVEIKRDGFGPGSKSMWSLLKAA